VQTSFRACITPESVCRLAEFWSVSESVIHALQLGFDSSRAAYSFPMVNGFGEVVGIRLRSYRDPSAKFCVPGSAQGLFVPRGVSRSNVQAISEGESDLAIALGRGVATIGRPSATAGVDEVIRFIGARRNACPVVFSDAGPEERRGAEKLATALLDARIPCRVLVPPGGHKDLRAWATATGLTADRLATEIERQRVRFPDSWAPGFSQVPHALLREGVIPALNHTAKKLGLTKLGNKAFCQLLVIASHWSRLGTFPERTEIARLTGTSVSVVERCNRVLHAAGLLRWRTGHTGRANEYELDFGPCMGAKRVHPFRLALRDEKREDEA